jgi:hypothetical protein
MDLNRVNPTPQLLKRRWIGAVIHHNKPLSLRIVVMPKRLIPLLPGRIPDLQSRLPAVNVYVLRLKIDPYGRRMGRCEEVIRESDQEGCLAHPTIANQHDFERTHFIMTVNANGFTHRPNAYQLISYALTLTVLVIMLVIVVPVAVVLESVA